MLRQPASSGWAPQRWELRRIPFFRKQGEQALRRIEPRSTGWREAHATTGMTLQPPAEHGGRMGAAPVKDQMGFRIGGRGHVNGAEQLAERDGEGSPMALARNPAGRPFGVGEEASIPRTFLMNS